jgi:hypothetical protein
MHDGAFLVAEVAGLQVRVPDRHLARGVRRIAASFMREPPAWT